MNGLSFCPLVFSLFCFSVRFDLSPVFTFFSSQNPP
jgi:hypothetical protein